jgi:hypothetical protein
MLAELDRSWLGKTLIGCTIQSYDPGIPGGLALYSRISGVRILGELGSRRGCFSLKPYQGLGSSLAVFQPVFRFRRLRARTACCGRSFNASVGLGFTELRQPFG